MKKIILIIGGVIFIAIAGRAIWAWQQVKNDEARIVSVATVVSPNSATENFAIKFDGTKSTSTSGIKIKGSLTIENKQTFTSTQLAKLKSDLTQLYLKYQGKDKNTEPTKSEFGKELDSIFLKDLGVDNVTTKNFGIFLYPEIASMMADINSSLTASPTPASVTGTPTATYMVNGVSNLRVNVGDKVKNVWSSTNADSFSDIISVDGCSSVTSNRTDGGEGTVNGSKSGEVPANYEGCTIIFTYTAKNTTTGKQATAVAIIKVN